MIKWDYEWMNERITIKWTNVTCYVVKNYEQPTILKCLFKQTKNFVTKKKMLFLLFFSYFLLYDKNIEKH